MYYFIMFRIPTEWGDDLIQNVNRKMFKKDLKNLNYIYSRIKVKNV